MAVAEVDEVIYMDPEDDPCDICSSEEECGCYGEDEDCGACGGYGWRTPEHCCDCGGSPYCQCCSTCGEYAGSCGCPVSVTRADGTVRIIPGRGAPEAVADDPDDFRPVDDDPDPEPPEDLEEAPAAGSWGNGDGGWADSPPF